MKYLDEKLTVLNTLLVKENLSRYGTGQVEQGWPGSSHRCRVSLQGA